MTTAMRRTTPTLAIQPIVTLKNTPKATLTTTAMRRTMHTAWTTTRLELILPITPMRVNTQLATAMVSRTTPTSATQPSTRATSTQAMRTRVRKARRHRFLSMSRSCSPQPPSARLLFTSDRAKKLVPED